MYSQIASNKRKTILMMVLFVLLVGALGWLFAAYFGEPAITPYVLIGAAVYALISYLAGTKMALGLNGAHEIQKKRQSQTLACSRKPSNNKWHADAQSLCYR